MKEKFIKSLIKIFADKTGCNMQYNNCPCNTCFHSIEKVDFRHLCWLIILGLRGDYKDKEILDTLKTDLK